MHSFIRDIFLFLINLQFVKIFANEHVCKLNKINICCIFLEHYWRIEKAKLSSIEFQAFERIDYDAIVFFYLAII